MGYLIILITVISIMITGSFGAIYVKEGGDANLQYQYPCESTEVTLSYGFEEPFYNSTDPDPASLPPNYKVINRNESRVGNCTLQLTIHRVTRDDGGVYFLTAFKNHTMVSKDGISLYVILNISPSSTEDTTPSHDPLPEDNTIPPSSHSPKPAEASKGSDRSVLSTIVICIFGIYVLIMLCLAMGMVIFRWDDIFNPPARPSGLVLGMEGCDTVPPDSQTLMMAAQCNEKKEPIMTNV